MALFPFPLTKLTIIYNQHTKRVVLLCFFSMWHIERKQGWKQQKHKNIQQPSLPPHFSYSLQTHQHISLFIENVYISIYIFFCYYIHNVFNTIKRIPLLLLLMVWKHKYGCGPLIPSYIILYYPCFPTPSQQYLHVLYLFFLFTDFYPLYICSRCLLYYVGFGI